MIGIVVGVLVAAAFGIYDVSRVTQPAWVGLPAEAPGLALDFGVDTWTLLPAFLFLGVIIAIQVNGQSINAPARLPARGEGCRFPAGAGSVDGRGRQ